MSITIGSRPSRYGKKRWYHFEWGKGADQRRTANVFTYIKPDSQVQRNHNKEALAILDTKKSQLVLERQSVGSGYIPTHKYVENFLDFYQQYVDNNPQKNNRHLVNSIIQFKVFLGKSFLSPVDLTENLCQRFQKFLLEHFNGDTPANYFACFKTVVKTATKQGYFRYSPAADVAAKANPAKIIKENLEADEYIQLLKTPLFNEEIRDAFIFSCYTGFRFSDVNNVKWDDLNGDSLTTRMIQHKTKKPLIVTLHPTAKAIIQKRISRKAQEARKGNIFLLPTHEACNKAIKAWVNAAGIKKHITWSCARLSFSILLQDANVDGATVALLLGHTTSKYVNETYKRHRPKDFIVHLMKLPG